MSSVDGWTRVGVKVFAGVVAFASVACGGARGGETRVEIGQSFVYAPQNTVVYDLGAHAESDAFDPSDARLLRALERLATSLGHSVELAIDLSTLPKPQGGFIERFLDRSINFLPTDAERYREREPDDFAICAPYVRRVELIYDGTREGLRATIDRAAGVLRVSLRPWDAAIARDALSASCGDVVAATLTERFAERGVESLNDAELRPYFRYASEVLPRLLLSSYPRRAPRLIQLGESPNVQLTSTMIALERRATRDAQLRAEVREWLVKWAREYGRQAVREARHLEEAATDHPWFAAGRELSVWLEGARPSLTRRELEAVLSAALASNSSKSGSRRQRYRHDVFPELDVLALGLQIWDAAPRDELGFPTHLPGFMCPTRIDSRGTRSSGACFSNFFLFVVEDDVLYPRLVDELRRRDAPQLVETVFAATGEAESDRVLGMWRALEPSVRSWTAATRALVSGRGRTQRERSREIYDDLVRQWRARSDRHAELLLALATLELSDQPRRGNGMVRFDDWTRIFGTAISPATYRAFLSLDPSAPRMAFAVFPALRPGPSRVADLLPLLPEPLGSGSAEQMFAGYRISVWDCLGTTIDALRALGDEAALAHVRNYLEERARQHPSQDGPLRAYIQRAR